MAFFLPRRRAIRRYRSPSVERRPALGRRRQRGQRGACSDLVVEVTLQLLPPVSGRAGQQQQPDRCRGRAVPQQRQQPAQLAGPGLGVVDHDQQRLSAVGQRRQVPGHIREVRGEHARQPVLPGIDTVVEEPVGQLPGQPGLALPASTDQQPHVHFQRRIRAPAQQVLHQLVPTGERHHLGVRPQQRCWRGPGAAPARRQRPTRRNQ
jgi:hypothetical protein